MKRSVKLTKKTAEGLVRRIFRGVKILDNGNKTARAVIFEADGPMDLVIKCENDWSAKNGRINLTISDRWGGGHITMCFDPETLERDMEAEDKLRDMEKGDKAV